MLKCLELAEKEYERSNGLYPMFHNTHEGYAVIKEEVDELWDEIKSSKVSTPDVMQRAEVIQIMAMCLKMSKLSYGFNIFGISEYDYLYVANQQDLYSTHEGYSYILHCSDNLWDCIKHEENAGLTDLQQDHLVKIIVACIRFLESFPES